MHKVAFRHNIFPKDILDFNPRLINARSYLYPGEELILPVAPTGQKRTECRGACVKEFSLQDLERYMKKWLDHQLAEITAIGHSVMERPLYLIKLGHGKKRVFYSGGWHANEWMTSKFLCDWIDDILDHHRQQKHYYGTNVTDLFKEVTLYVTPMVNPDGITLVQQGNYPEHPYHDLIKEINKDSPTFDHWSANIRGVDLNHQWPARWQKEADESPQMPWSRHYSGTAPLTEPEAKAVYSLTKAGDFTYVLAFHSQGQVIYWGYNGMEPPESEQMVRQLSLHSSYVPVHTADSDAGFKDWFIQETGRPGFTIEVGAGINPLPFHAYGEIWANNVLLALEGLKM
ncbi:g-D-glutamyl-meso-diaminopimelate peptidase [Evansella caseinilytica]|uniref:G-D-glutamyl-meso-diaminopimelate peptidase n=1 Tax=Evansella caseinilytica TaxID=1503961 RepID=A0A1H3L9D0_9BACI|nr:g-D-glutamyl-meso-diaminopimelate peptidase [Evansella caseinilytica]